MNEDRSRPHAKTPTGLVVATRSAFGEVNYKVAVSITKRYRTSLASTRS